jgi:hypothetical protein
LERAKSGRDGCRVSVADRQHVGGRLSNVEFVIAADDVQAVDPGFGTAILVNGPGLIAGVVLRHRGGEATVHRAPRPIRRANGRLAGRDHALRRLRSDPVGELSNGS